MKNNIPNSTPGIEPKHNKTRLIKTTLFKSLKNKHMQKFTENSYQYFGTDKLGV